MSKHNITALSEEIIKTNPNMKFYHYQEDINLFI
jgi:hypothetical protein